MVKVLLTTRPNYDVITSYLHAFSEEIIRNVKAMKEFHLTDLEGELAVRKNLEKALGRDGEASF